MSNKIRQVVIDFPVEVEINDKWTQAIVAMVSSVCDRYEKTNPTRVMWPFGVGSMAMMHPMRMADGAMQYDEKVLHIEVMEREEYRVTEALSLSKLLEELKQKLRSGHIDLTDASDMLTKAFALGLKDYAGRSAGRELVQQLRRTAADVGTHLIWLRILAKREPSGELVIHPYELAELTGDSTVSIHQDHLGSVVVQYRPGPGSEKKEAAAPTED